MGYINESKVKTYKDKKWIYCDRCNTHVVLDDELHGMCITCGEEIEIVFDSSSDSIEK